MNKPGPSEADIDYDARFKALEKHPLFMRNLPEGESNPTLDALQSLIYDDTPNNIASNFKDQGNEYFRGKRYREALGFYSQGIDANPDDQTLLESLLLNRAACNLELQNYASTLRDCSSVIKIRLLSSKAYYRSARALIALNRLDDAIDCCAKCLEFDADNASVKGLMDEARKKGDAKRKTEEEKERKKKEAKAEKDLLEFACKARQLTFKTTPSPDKVGFPTFDTDEPKPYTPTSQILFPVFFLYPQYNASDFVPSFAEHTSFNDQLAVIFPSSSSSNVGVQSPNWDKNTEYKAGKLAVYATTRLGRLLKIGAKMSLADVFLRAGIVVDVKGSPVQDGLELVDGCLSFVVVPKGDVEKGYVEEYKQKHAQHTQL